MFPVDCEIKTAQNVAGIADAKNTLREEIGKSSKTCRSAENRENTQL
jgi:hypothetical protein